jgi:hypothetical protein
MGPASASYGLNAAYMIPLAEDTGMKIRQVGDDTLTLRYKWVGQGRFFWTDFESINSMDMLTAKGEFATRDGGPFQMRIVYPAGSPRYLGFPVRGDSSIRTPQDIKPGTRMIYLTVAPAVKGLQTGLARWANLSPDDVEWIPASTVDGATKMLMDGKGDIAFGFPLAPTWYEAAASPKGVAWIELDPKADPEGLKRFREIIPMFSFGKNSTGVESAIGVTLLTELSNYGNSADHDPELVYQIVKWLDENYDMYKDTHERAEGMNIDNLMVLAETDFLPLHDGAVKYLEEKGLWTAAHETRRQANINLITTYVEAYQTALDMADEQEIAVSPKNEPWLELWGNYKTELGLPGFKMFAGLD